jgi:4-amino-4-deoxy-L-arabinose transferase-like glycosyltransferase
MFSCLKNRKVVWLLAICFAVTVAYAFVHQIHPVVDARAYDQIGWNLAQGNGYFEDPSHDPIFDTAIIRVGPLFEYMLAGVYTMFGHHYEPVWVIHAILHTLSALFIYLTAKIVFARLERVETIALWAAGLFAFSPDLIEIAAMLMTETLYLFFFTVLVYYFMWFVESDKGGIQSKFVVLLGVITGLSILARPPVLFILPVIYLYFLLKKKWKEALIVTVAIVAVFTPWSIQNYQTYGQFMPTGGAGVYNFWIGNHEGASGEQVQPQEAVDYIAEHGVIALQDESFRQFTSFVLEHPLEFAKLTLLRVNRYFSVARPMGFWFYQDGWQQLAFILSSVLWSGTLFVLAVAGILKGMSIYKTRLTNCLYAKDNPAWSYIVYFAMLTPLVLFITVVESRYRFQIYPLLAIFAGYAAVCIFSKKKWWKNKFLLWAMSIIGVNTLVDVGLSFGKVIEKLGLFF